MGKRLPARTKPGQHESKAPRAGAFDPLFAAHPLPMWIHEDETLRILDVNASAIRLYGYSREQFLEMTVDALEVPAPAEAEAPSAPAICRHLTAQGTSIWVRLERAPVDSGGRRASLTTILDVTREVETERALRDNEQRFRQLFEIAADYYFEQDEHYGYSYVSPGYEAIFGTTLAQVRGKRLSDLADVSIEPRMGKMAILAHKAKQPYRDFVYSRKAADGRTRWFKVSATPIFTGDGRFRGYRGVGAEITQQVEAEQAARLAQLRFDEVAALVTQPFVVYDAKGLVTAFNQAFTDLHFRDGYTPVCRGASYHSIAQWQVHTGFHAASTGNPPVTLEMLLEHYASEAEHTYGLRDGRWMLVAYRTLPGGGRVGLWTEITAIRRAKDDAEAANRAKSEFLARMSHELRTPLNAVIGYSEMLYEDAAAEGRSEHAADLGRIVGAGKHLLSLVNDVLDLSKIEAGKMELSLAPFDFGRFVDELAETCRPLMAENRNDFVVERGEGLGTIVGDAVKLRQVALNLLSNAAKFTRGGRITLVAARDQRPDGDWIDLAVRDTGVGISRENLPRLFQNFSQIESFSSSRHGGSGLGLALSRKLCHLMGGEISVASELGQGSCFTVRIPAARPAAATPELAAS